MGKVPGRDDREIAAWRVAENPGARLASGGRSLKGDI